jgi:DNA-binding CsgD family transcriptional regulator
MPAQPSLLSSNHAGASQVETSLRDIFRSLVERLPPSAAASTQERTQSDADEILVDAELDGWRYILIRTARPSTPLVQLSPREREIVRMVAEGHPNKIIAAVLNISTWTVGTHLRRIFAKLGVGSRAAMVARYLEIRKAAAPPQSNGTNRRSLASVPANIREIKDY